MTGLIPHLAHRIRTDERTNTRFFPLLLGKENYSGFNLGSLWERIAGALTEQEPELVSVVLAIRERIEVTDDAQYYLDLLARRIASLGVCLLLFVEHFDRILRKLEEKERSRMLVVLRDFNALSLVAASASTDELSACMTPFLLLFDQIRLLGLSITETEALSQSRVRGDTEHWFHARPGLARIWCQITGGRPRLLHHLARVIDGTCDNAFADLLDLCDRVTPDYQPGINRLPTQQQANLQIIALYWDTTHAGYFAEHLRLPSKLVSAQLSQMVRHDSIDKRSANRENHLYFLRDRFFQLWFLVRHGHDRDRLPLQYFMDFVSLWSAPREARNGVPAFEREADLTNPAWAGKPNAWADLGAFFEAQDRADMAEIALQKGSIPERLGP